MFAVGCLTGIVLFVVGSILDRRERARREREFRDRRRHRGSGRER